MHFTQQTVLAVAVLASSALAVPVPGKAASESEYWKSLASRDASNSNSEWTEITSRDIMADINKEIDNLKSRDVMDEINKEIDNLKARDVLEEINAQIDNLKSRSVLDELNEQVDAITARGVEADEWREITVRDIEARDDAEYWHTIAGRDLETRAPKFSLGGKKGGNSAPKDPNAQTKSDKFSQAAGNVETAGGLIGTIGTAADTVKGWFGGGDDQQTE